MIPTRDDGREPVALDRISVRLVRDEYFFRATLAIYPAGGVFIGPPRETEAAARADGELLLEALLRFEVVDRTDLSPLPIPALGPPPVTS